jgi:hypothetical protein
VCKAKPEIIAPVANQYRTCFARIDKFLNFELKVFDHTNHAAAMTFGGFENGRKKSGR